MVLFVTNCIILFLPSAGLSNIVDIFQLLSTNLLPATSKRFKSDIMFYHQLFINYLL